MYTFKLESDVSLLTVTREGMWSLKTVRLYETDLRIQLELLHRNEKPTAFIVDIRSSVPQSRIVADALRAMVAGLGALNADRTAVVTLSGLAKLQARRISDPSARIFMSMMEARAWILNVALDSQRASEVYDEPSDAATDQGIVHVHGPSDVDIAFTPSAALETAKRITEAAVEALVRKAAT